jgi:hypothetical protein
MDKHLLGQQQLRIILRTLSVDSSSCLLLTSCPQ